MSSSYAAGVAAEIPRSLPEPDEWNGWLRVISVHDTADALIEIIYEREEHDFLLGLRIALDPAREPGGEVQRIVESNLCEPLGAYEDDLVEDDQGVRWWTGEPARWSYGLQASAQEAREIMRKQSSEPSPSPQGLLDRD